MDTQQFAPLGWTSQKGDIQKKFALAYGGRRENGNSNNNYLSLIHI